MKFRKLRKSELEACSEITQGPHHMGYDVVDIEDDIVRPGVGGGEADSFHTRIKLGLW